jgi:hypothetical protein
MSLDHDHPHHHENEDILGLANLWGPRILVALSIVLLIYFTITTHLFRGYFDETFLSESNLRLSRGPLAPKAYYERGLLDYKPKPLFVSDTKAPAAETGTEIPAEAAETIREETGQPAVSPAEPAQATAATSPAS